MRLPEVHTSVLPPVLAPDDEDEDISAGMSGTRQGAISAPRVPAQLFFLFLF